MSNLSLISISAPTTKAVGSENSAPTGKPVGSENSAPTGKPVGSEMITNFGTDGFTRRSTKKIAEKAF